MQAVECGIPVVTKEGRSMRGRFGSGILNRMGLPELIARTDSEYAGLAIRLGKDPEYRSRMRQRIQTSRSVLFDDLMPVRAPEEFLIKIASRS